MTPQPEDDSFLGESPPLPPSLIADLHATIVGKLWDTAANATAYLFEAWRRG